MSRVILQPVFVLHSRPYGNTSLLVELFSKHHGRIVALARSARGLSSRYKGKLQLFTPILASWSGKRELMYLGDIELASAPFQLEGKELLCAFYLNELVVRLLHRDDPHPFVFQLYQDTLIALEKRQDLQATLRCFEKQLLQRLGYAIPLTRDAQTGDPICSESYYQYIPERGFLRCDDVDNAAIKFPGSSLIAFHQEHFPTQEIRRDAKRLMRLILSRHLGNIKSGMLWGCSSQSQ